MKLPALRFSKKPSEMDRRDFLKAGAAAATITLAPGVTLMAFGGGEAKANANPAIRWGLLIDVNKCQKDCDVCVTACSIENGWKNTGHPETDSQWIRKVDLKDMITGREESLPLMCQHCAEPPCVDVCPTGASFIRADGIVLVDKHICIGCRYCMMACPYKARSFVAHPITDQITDVPRGMGVVESCTLCVQRIDRGEIPACVEACKKTGYGAIMFGDLNDPESDIAKALANYPSTALRADLGVKPGVRYQNL